MTKKSLEEVIKEYKQFGFDQTIIQIAYANVNGQKDKILQEIFRLQTQSNSYPVKPSNPQDEDAQLSKAIQMSINQAKDKKISLEPLNPEQRVRKSGVPVGLKNIGNTCYFNSLLQTYFQNATFVKEILKYEIPQKYKTLTNEQIQKKSQQDFEFKRKFASCKLVESLKFLFSQMIGSDRKYIDPTAVLTSIVDDYGNQLPIGDQKDIGQFNLIFLSRVDQGLNEYYQNLKMEIQGQRKMMEDSSSKLKVVGAEENMSELASHSLLKRSSIKLNENSMLSKQFIGKIMNSFNNKKTKFHKQQSELFSLLFVNVKHKQLYQALEEVVLSDIEDYRNEKGEIVGVQKRTWIQQAPKTLFFQIDRVIFDKQKSQLYKINDIFDFPKQFYIDPFLYRNKDKALQIQQRVKKLRQQKQNYLSYLHQLEHYGKEKQNLLKTMLIAHQFLESQTIKMQLQLNSKRPEDKHPLIFENLHSQISPNHLELLKNYAKAISGKQAFYKETIKSIEIQIQHCYESIRTKPYNLYSILIHQGNAEMGHYYSYIFDIQSNSWKKYNDINIFDESPEKVFQEAKGINTTSAYYLVYAQKDVLMPYGSEAPIKNHKTSTDQQGYLKDLYSSFLTKQLKDKIISENHAMYYEIQQYKMGGFATRVIDCYAKQFQICNETFRKTKPAEKKKNSPPILINLPVYLKNIDENEYKSLLIEHSIQQYGPKEYNPAFQEMLTKKMNNFNEFKRPKKFISAQKYLTNFMQDIYQSIAAKSIFTAIKESSYKKVYNLLTQLLRCQNGTYFHWLATILTKTFVVHLLLEAESQICINQAQSIEKLKLMVLILFKFINLNDERILLNNCIFWSAEINIDFKNEEFKKIGEKLTDMLQQKSYKGEFDQQFINNQEGQNIVNSIKGCIEISDACWNLSRTQDVYINKMLQARQQVKQKIEVANQMYRQMKKANLPLQKNERQRIKDRKLNH